MLKFHRVIRVMPGVVGCVVLLLTSSIEGQSTEAAKTELYAIPTTTLTDAQFLTGAKDGKAEQIVGELRLPRGGTGRFAAVLILHGSGGFTAQEEHWARLINDLGVASFVLDGFTPRGIVSTSSDQAQLSTLTMVNDAYRAADLLAKHPRIDSSRIAVIGSSRGAKIAVAASMKRFQALYGSRAVAFVAYIGFYTPCSIRYIQDTEVDDRPIRLFHGADDDFTPIQPCRSYVDDLKRGGKDVELRVYEGAYHLFDNPGTPLGRNEQSQTAKQCSWVERTTGQVVNSTTGRVYSLEDPCVQRGVTRGFNAAAHVKADQDLKTFLAQVLKLQR